MAEPNLRTARAEATEHRAVPGSGLVVRLLGAPEISWRGQPVTLGTKAARSLLALLLIRRKLLDRESVAADLWPDLGARSSVALRQALWVLRSGLSDAGARPDQLIESDDEFIGLRWGEYDVYADVLRFEYLMMRRPQQAEEAVRIYRGELAAAGLECFSHDRERLADLYEDALALVAGQRLRLGDWAGAETFAIRLLDRDPLREEAYVAMFEVYGRVGTRPQLTRLFLRMRTLLADQLQVAPLAETMAIYRGSLARIEERSRQAVTERWCVPPLRPLGHDPGHSRVTPGA